MSVKIVRIKLIEKFEYVKLKNVIFSYTEESNKIKIPEFVLNIGDKISIMGESGQGKTTAMNILAGLYPLQHGYCTLIESPLSPSEKKVSFLSAYYFSELNT